MSTRLRIMPCSELVSGQGVGPALDLGLVGKCQPCLDDMG